MKLFYLVVAILLVNGTLKADIENIINGKINKVIVATEANQIQYPTDLDFNMSAENQLWILNHGLEDGGSTVMITDPSTDLAEYDYRKDGNAWHFLVYGTALAFGDTTWATAQNYFNANRQFFGGWCGPSMWPSDLSIYAIVGNPPNAGANGSHYDMVHQSPYTSGIAHEVDNTYWVNDGENGAISKYNFNEAHVPGGDDHSDAEVYRHVDVPYDMNAGIPAHMILDGNWLYYINPGTKSINRLDITTGQQGNSLKQQANGNEPLQTFVEMNNTVWETVVDSGLESPSGIDIKDNYMIVSDNETGEIIIYDISSGEASEVKRLNTGAASIMGVKFDTEGDIYFVDHLKHEVVKLEGNSGINYYTDTPHLNIAESGNTTLNVIVENNTDEDITVETYSSSISEQLYSSESNGLAVAVETNVSPNGTTIAAGNSAEFPVAFSTESGNGFVKLDLELEITASGITSVYSDQQYASTNNIPLINVFDGLEQNISVTGLDALLNSTGYGDHINMNTIDFQKLAMSAEGVETVIFNSAAFGSNNAQEYGKFAKLRDQGTSIYYSGDRSLQIIGSVSPENNFNLNAFGSEYLRTSNRGYNSNGNYTLSGVDNDPISSDFNTLQMGLTIFDNGNGITPSSLIQPMGDSSYSVFNFETAPDSTIAVRNERDDSRSFISSFNMFNVVQEGQRSLVFKSIMDWLTYKDATGIFELAGYKSFEIFPNPADNFIRINQENIKPNTEVLILDISGRTIRRIDSYNSEINISKLETGSYFLMLKNSNELQVSKFIKR